MNNILLQLPFQIWELLIHIYYWKWEVWINYIGREWALFPWPVYAKTDDELIDKLESFFKDSIVFEIENKKWTIKYIPYTKYYSWN